jgi:putative ABC transport system substrate-binding protein
MKLRHTAFLIMSILGVLLVSGTAEAQAPAKVAHIGWLALTTATAPAPTLDAFRQGMRALGYVEGHHFVLEPRYAGGKPELLPALAADLVRVGVDVIIAGTAPALRAAMQTTSRIPILMTPSSDPVARGAVQSLTHPGGNVTGITEMAPQLTPRRLELLKELVPTLSRVAILLQPGTLSEAMFTQMVQTTQDTARTLGVHVQVVEANAVADFDAAFAAIERDHADALIVLLNPLFFVERKQLIERAAQHRLPAIFERKAFVRSGGLISYGADVADIYRRVAGLVDKILQGAQPADLPVEGPTHFDLAVNVKTAKALGLTLPPSVLAQAVEVIE